MYGNLAGNLDMMFKNFVLAIDETNVGKLIYICSIGIYDEPVKGALNSYQATSNLDYTILRPSWFTQSDEVDYEISGEMNPNEEELIHERA